MINKKDAMDRLNSEKLYEDHLVDVLSNYFLFSIDFIHDLDGKQKKKINEYLKEIAYDSSRHSLLFNDLVQMVFESESDYY